MTGQKKQDGTIDRTFLQGLDLMLGSLIQKNDAQSENPPLGVTEEVGSDVKGDVDVGSVLEDADNGAMDKQKDPKKSPKGTKSLSGVDKIGVLGVANIAGEMMDMSQPDALGGDDEEKSHIKDATDLGDKTNLPPEMGRKDDKGSEGLVDDGSIAEPMLRHREVRKSVLGDIDRGVDIFNLWANVDKIIEKSSDYSPHVSDVDILKSFGLCECTKTEDIVEGTLVYKMLIDRGSRPSSEWWNECITFAKSVEGMEEPAFFAAFMYYEPDNFNPEYFMKGLNDTGGTPRTSRRGLSHDTEIDENIGAAGGQAIDGLGMSNDGDKNFEDECDCPNHEDSVHKA